MTSQKNEALYAIPLGGSDEIGLNMMLYECGDDMIMVDCGMGFGDSFTPGIDVVIPDIRYVRENIHKLKAIFITHAHEDHIGAIPYLWEELKAPIYATPFTAQLIGGKMERYGLSEKEFSLNVVQPGNLYNAGCFGVEFIHVTHSVPGSANLAIHTPHGLLFNTGDYKLDDQPVLGHVSNLERVEEIAKQNILAVFGDSTDTFKEGRKISETELSSSLEKIISEQPNAIFVSPISSNVERMLSISEIAVKHNRKICFFGRALENMMQYARQCNLLPDYLLPHIIDSSEIKKYPRENVLVFVTGAQGQHNAMLNRLSDGKEFRGAKIQSGDTVIFSARKIPGCEQDIASLENRLTHLGVRVIDRDSALVHIGGHGQKEEALELYRLLQPEFIVPSYGSLWHIKEHERMIKESDLQSDVYVITNGDRLKLAPGTPECVGKVSFGRHYVDGMNILDEDRFILKERRLMSFEGLATVTLVIDMQSKEVLKKPIISTKGLIDETLQADLIASCQAEVSRALKVNFGGGMRIDDVLQAETIMYQAVRRYMKHERGRKPVTIAQVVEI